MKKLVLILSLFLFTSCVSKIANNPPSSGNNTPASTTAHPSAVYFIQESAKLSSQDLQSHSEIVVVRNFDELKQYANQKIALWIDKSATPFTAEEQEWMNQSPQVYYPTVLVGSSDTLHSFRDLLGLCCFMGPGGSDAGADASGFSVIQREESADPSAPAVSFIQGYNQEPTAQAILEITNALLKAGPGAAPSASFTPPSTPTP